MTRTARKITFPNVGVEQGSRVWRNRETGIEIIKGKNFAEVGLYYVCHPTMDPDGRAVGFAVTTMHEARECAHRLARYMRIRIERAHDEALREDSGRERQRLANWKRNAGATRFSDINSMVDYRFSDINSMVDYMAAELAQKAIKLRASS